MLELRDLGLGDPSMHLGRISLSPLFRVTHRINFPDMTQNCRRTGLFPVRRLIHIIRSMLFELSGGSFFGQNCSKYMRSPSTVKVTGSVMQ